MIWASRESAGAKMTIILTQTCLSVRQATQNYDKFFSSQTAMPKDMARSDTNLDDYAFDHITYNHFYASG